MSVSNDGVVAAVSTSWQFQNTFQELDYMHNRIVLLEIVVILGTATFSGCPSTSSPPQRASPSTASVSDEGSHPSYPRQFAKYVDPEHGEIEEWGSPVAASIVEQWFHKLDWSDPASKPRLGVELALNSSLEITLSPDATENHVEMIAVWTRPGPQLGAATSVMVRRSKPLKDAEQGMALLHSFAKRGDEFESLAEWVDKKRQPADKSEPVSALLRQQMIDITSEVAKEQNAATKAEVIAKQVDDGITAIRKQDPSFLILSAKAEAKLKNGDVIEDSNARIAAAEQFLKEFGIELSGLAAFLLKKHRTSALSNERAELLAQLLVAQVKQAKKALAN